MENEVGCLKTLERDLFDEEMILLIWRRRTRGEGPGEFGSAEGTLNTHLPSHSAASNRAGAVPQFPACALRVPQLQSCCAEKHPPEVTGRFRRVMQGGKPKSDLPAGGRKRWHLRQPHNCHRTLHNTTGSFHLVLYWHLYPANPRGLYNIYAVPKSVPVHTVMPSTGQDYLYFGGA